MNSNSMDQETLHMLGALVFIQLLFALVVYFVLNWNLKWWKQRRTEADKNETDGKGELIPLTAAQEAENEEIQKHWFLYAFQLGLIVSIFVSSRNWYIPFWDHYYYGRAYEGSMGWTSFWLIHLILIPIIAWTNSLCKEPVNYKMYRKIFTGVLLLAIGSAFVSSFIPVHENEMGSATTNKHSLPTHSFTINPNEEGTVFAEDGYCWVIDRNESILDKYVTKVKGGNIFHLTAGDDGLHGQLRATCILSKTKMTHISECPNAECPHSNSGMCNDCLKMQYAQN